MDFLFILLPYPEFAYLVNSNSKFHIKLQDIPTKLFLIYGLNPIHAATIGLLVSEYFIKKLNF